MKYFIETKRHKPTSPELKVFWKAGSCGYTENPVYAGLYTKEKATGISESTHGDDVLHPETNFEDFQKAYLNYKKKDMGMALEGLTETQARLLLDTFITERKNYVRNT